jgi:hypothetical protein
VREHGFDIAHGVIDEFAAFLIDCGSDRPDHCEREPLLEQVPIDFGLVGNIEVELLFVAYETVEQVAHRSDEVRFAAGYQFLTQLALAEEAWHPFLHEIPEVLLHHLILHLLDPTLQQGPPSQIVYVQVDHTCTRYRSR